MAADGDASESNKGDFREGSEGRDGDGIDGRVMDLLLSIGCKKGEDVARTWAEQGPRASQGAETNWHPKQVAHARMKAGAVGLPDRDETRSGGRMSAGGQLTMCSGERRLRAEMMGKLLAAASVEAIAGMAFATAGVTCGLGGWALQKWGLIALMQEWFDDSSSQSRLRALLLLQAIAAVHARQSEAYVVYLFPKLLAVLADNNRVVFQVAEECLKTIVSSVSGSGAQRITPSMLQHLAQAQSWRSRVLIARTLGVMVVDRPRQLSGHMPIVIAALADAVREAHPEVARAAKESLVLVAGLSRCAPIRSVLPVLVSALEVDRAHE